MTDDERLREEAKRRLERREARSPRDLGREEMLEELTVHGIELEMQTDELQRTGEALERSRDAYAELFELAPIGFMVIDQALCVSKANHAARRLLDGPTVGTSFLSLVRRATMGEVATWLRSVKREPCECDLATMGPQGEPRIIHVHARRDDDGQVLLSLIDVTEARGATKELEQRERDLRQLTDLAPDAVCVVTEGHVVYANHQFENLVGIDRARLQGEAVRNLVLHEDRDAFDQCLTRAGHMGPHRPLRFVDGDDRERTVELRTMRFVFARRPSVLMMGRDLTDRRRLQARVERAERLATVGMLVAGVAHEVNNPLAYCMSNLEVVRQRLETSEDDELLEAVRDAQGGAMRVKNIVRDLRAFNQVDDELTVIEPNRVVMQALRMAEREVKPVARLRRDLGVVPNLTANENRLVQVVLNLVINAAQAMKAPSPADNWIRLRTWSMDEDVCIAIEDNGPGIAQENLTKVFDPFFTTRRGEGGTGLGLAICNSLVQQMGGFIEVDSTVGKGTRFLVRLRATEASADVMSSTPPDARRFSPYRRLRFAIIDDERPLVRSIRRLVHDIADVEEAHSGHDGIALLQANPGEFDLVLCDLVMTNGTGEDVAEWLRRSQPELLPKLVFMTGMAHPNVQAPVVAPVLAKPFTREALEEILARVSRAWSNPPIAMGNEE